MPGILGYDRFINSDGNAEFNLILMDYRANNDGKIHNKNKRSGQIEVNVGRVDTMGAKSSVWPWPRVRDLTFAKPRRRKALPQLYVARVTSRQPTVSRVVWETMALVVVIITSPSA